MLFVFLVGTVFALLLIVNLIVNRVPLAELLNSLCATALTTLWDQ